ncbi:phage tail protein [Terrimonas sp. NA20]|uniref:Phage tail protein n=1 Tax=Terrimonas ginsenosidimutans TaxID=2908004 RepID=A0ABS9KRK6_9BACT|nr:phage tail protein [Terrimonas ginsenosidimutans]MCG2614909.1 phage tail protein [Terrimonas ginsenosidimutans]
MTNRDTTLADSIAHIPHFAAFDALVKKRFSEIELDKLLVYLIDTVDASAIPYLAEQFDVLGYKGFRLAQTEADQREIIKRSIELHRFKGTLWAVEEALKAVGYGDAIIEEHVEGHWANFRVTVDIGTHPVNAQEIEEVVRMIKEYKNTRSHLVDLSYTINFGDDQITVDDEMQVSEASADEDTITAGGDFRHDGTYLRNGLRNYSQDSDTLTIQII